MTDPGKAPDKAHHGQPTADALHDSAPAVSRARKQQQSARANIGRARGSSEPGAKTQVLIPRSHTPNPGVCHVCGRVGCPLFSHRTYVFPDRTRCRSNVSNVALQGIHPDPRLEELHPRQILEIRTGKFDPFIHLPVEGRMRDEGLFQHFFKISAGRIVTATGRNATQNIITSLLPLALSHPAVCQGAIVYAAAQVANIRGDIVPAKLDLQAYNKSLRLLHQAMLEDPMGFKDVFIFAAIGAAGFDLTYGRKEELRRHVDGIYNIVRGLGGLQHLGMGGVGAHLVLWVDFFASIMLNRSPLYELPSRPEITLPGPPPIYGAAFHSLAMTGKVDEGLRAACEQTCRLSELLEKITRDPGPSAEVEYFTYKRNLTDHKFAICHARHVSNATGSYTTKMTTTTSAYATCICLTAITMELWILHNVGDTHSIFHHLGVSLQKALLSTDDLMHFWASSGDSGLDNDQDQAQNQPQPRDILQWILFSAGAIMTERNGRRWYRNMARQSLMHRYGDDRRRGPRPRSEWPAHWRDLVQQNCRRFLWSDIFLESHFRAFCKSVVESLDSD